MIKNNRNKIMAMIFLCIIVLIFILPDKKNKIVENHNYITNPHTILNDDTLKIGIPYRTNPLNPINDGRSNVSLISKLLNSSLLSRDRSNNFLPVLADQYWFDDGGKTISVILKSGIKFKDGTEFNASHVKNTYMSLASPNYGGNYSSFVDNMLGYYPYKLGQTEDFAGVEVVEDYYIKFHFNLSDFSNISSLTFPILDLTEEEIADPQSYIHKEFTNGVGIYNLVKHEGRSYTLKLKDQYKDLGISAEEIEIFNLTSIDAMKEYKQGRIDIVYKYIKDETINNSFDKRTQEYSYNIDHQASFYHFLGFNSESEIFSNPDYRRALRDSFNIEEIVSTAYGQGVYNFPKVPLYRNSWFNDQDFTMESGLNLHDLLKSQMDNQDNPPIGQGQKLNIKLIALTDDNFFRRIEEDFVAGLENELVNVDVEYLESGDMYAALRGNKDFDIFVSQRHLTEMPNLSLEDRYPVEGDYNLITLADEAYYYILEKIKSDTSDSLIVELQEEWENNFESLAPYIVLATENETTIVNNRVKNIYLNEFIGLDNLNNLENIEIEKNQ